MINRQMLLLNDSVRAYERLLVLYPADFRQEFGPDMSDLFRALAEAQMAQRGALGLLWAWGRVLRELPGTVAREHGAALAQRNPGVAWRRLALAAFLPILGAAAWRLGKFEPPPASLVALWLTCCVMPALAWWGRGWASVVAAMRGGATAMSLAIVWSGLSEGPGAPLWPALVLVACAATAGLTVGVVVRAVVEGLVLRPANGPPSATIT